MDHEDILKNNDLLSIYSFDDEIKYNNSQELINDSQDSVFSFENKLNDHPFIMKEISESGDNSHLHLFYNFQQNDSSDSSFEEFNCYKLEKYQHKENSSKKQTSASGSNSSENDLQKSLKKDNNKILIKDSEKYSRLTVVSKENNKEIPFQSYEEIVQKYGEKFSDLNISGNGENTKEIEAKLKEKNQSKNTEKNENLLNRKRKSVKKEDDKNLNCVQINKLGRKKNGDNSGVHNKMKDDNLIFKIKSNFNNWLLNLINQFLPKEMKLMKINFQKFSKIISTEENKKYLEMENSEIFSQNISDIYSKIQRKQGKNRNKIIIQQIMESDNEKAKKLLKMKYKESLDLYRFKEGETYLKNYLGDEIINEIGGRVDELLINTFDKEKKKIGNNGADDFVSSLLVMVYNYERWFSMKKSRKPKTKKGKTKKEGNNETEEPEDENY